MLLSWLKMDLTRPSQTLRSKLTILFKPSFHHKGCIFSNRIPDLTSQELEVLKKAESKFVALDIKPEYVIDKINNGYESFICYIDFNSKR